MSVETPATSVTETAEAPVATKSPTVAKSATKAKVAKKPQPAKKPAKKAKPAAAKGSHGGMTFSQLMKTRLADGSLRTPHENVLKGVGKANGAVPFSKIVTLSKVNPRSAQPAVQFLVSEGLMKEQVSEDEGRTYKITGDGSKYLAKLSK